MPESRSARLPWSRLQRLAGAAVMAEMDRRAIQEVGLPGRLLMENAAQAVTARVCDLLEGMAAAGAVAVICGAGNNGGDGYAVARLLANRGIATTVVALGTPGAGDAGENAAVWKRFGETVPWVEARAQAETVLDDAVLLVDAVFGTGLSRAVTGEAETLILRLNTAAARGAAVVAVDLPSGIHADTGQVLGVAVRCTHTVTFQVGKPGCYQHPGAGYAGQVEVAPISIPEAWPGDDPGTYLLTSSFVRAVLPARPATGHKGTFGHVLALCGSAGMGGAAALAARSALRIGSGLVTLGVPLCLRDRFLDEAPELMTLTAPGGGEERFAGEDAAAMLDAAAARDAVVLGCGLGRSAETQAFVRTVAAGVNTPLLIDADGLYHLEPGQLQSRTAPTVLTPHPGELERLSGMGREALAQDRAGAVRRLAGEWGVVLVLKGAGTVVGDPEGRVFINPTGDSGLATGGTGDVLSGMIGGLMAQGLEPLAAALAGVFLHGLARDVQRERITAEAFTAGDLLQGIDPALRQVREDMHAARAGDN